MLIEAVPWPGGAEPTKPPLATEEHFRAHPFGLIPTAPTLNHPCARPALAVSACRSCCPPAELPTAPAPPSDRPRIAAIILLKSWAMSRGGDLVPKVAHGRLDKCERALWRCLADCCRACRGTWPDRQTRSPTLLRRPRPCQPGVLSTTEWVPVRRKKTVCTSRSRVDTPLTTSSRSQADHVSARPLLPLPVDISDTPTRTRPRSACLFHCTTFLVQWHCCCCCFCSFVRRTA